MIYRPFGSTGFEASAIGLGTWNISNQWGPMDEATSIAIINAALDAGVNLIDTAEAYGLPYGLSEERIGKALAGRRHQVHLVTKVGFWGMRTGQAVPMKTNDMFVLCCQGSLYRMRTDYIDVYLCHVGNLPAGETEAYLEGFAELKRRGMIGCFGVSTDDLEVLKRFNVNGDCKAVELDYSLINRSAENGILKYAQEHHMAVLVRGPLAMGVLSGKYDHNSTFSDTVRSAWNEGTGRDGFNQKINKLEKILQIVPKEELVETAIRFVISHPVAPVAIPGSTSPKQAAANARVGDRLFTPEELARFEAIR